MGEQPALSRRLPPPPRQMGMEQAQPRETNSPSDSKSLPQQDRVGGRDDELIAARSEQLAGRIDGAEMEQRPMGNSASIAKAAIRQNITTFKTMMDASEAERQKSEN